jgi:hypothetical protein
VRTRTALLVLLLVVTIFLPCRAQPSDWCYGLDQFSAVAHDSTITVTHSAALYNCCPVDIVYSLEQVGSLFVIHETEVEPQCLCFCCFNLSVDINHVAPGGYDIEFHWYDTETGPQVRYLHVTVPDVGQTVPAALGPRSISACMGTGGTEGPPPLTARSFRLWPASPNPMTDGTRLQYQLASAVPARLSICSAAGVEVRRLRSDVLPEGMAESFWDGTDDAGRPVPGGVYYFRLVTPDGVATRPVIVLH